MDVQKPWDINLCSPDCNLIAGHLGSHLPKIVDLWLESERRRCGEDSQLPEEWSSADIEKAALAWWAGR